MDGFSVNLPPYIFCQGKIWWERGTTSFYSTITQFTGHHFYQTFREPHEKSQCFSAAQILARHSLESDRLFDPPFLCNIRIKAKYLVCPLEAGCSIMRNVAPKCWQMRIWRNKMSKYTLKHYFSQIWFCIYISR